MSWPTPQEYQEAVQNPAVVFSDPELKGSTVECDRLGMPRPRSGNFAVAYKATTARGKDWAVRCFMREVGGQQQRYRAIHQELERRQLPFTARFEYQADGICMHGQWYPILKMEWVQGEGLAGYVERNLNAPDRLDALADEAAGIVRQMSSLDIAHGDLQHGNILVVADRLRLIDYDGMFVRGLSGQKSAELGHPNYQHPHRDETHFGPTLDHFSLWVIYLSLKALSADPGLWARHRGGDDCLLFRKGDFLDPVGSALFRDFDASPSAPVRQLNQVFRSLLQVGPLKMPMPVWPSEAGGLTPGPKQSPVATRPDFHRDTLVTGEVGGWLPLPTATAEVGGWLPCQPVVGSNGFAGTPVGLSMRVDEVLNTPAGPPLEPDEAQLDFTNNVDVDQALLLITVLVSCALLGFTLFRVVPVWLGVGALPMLFGGCVLSWRLRYQQNRDEAVTKARRVELELTSQLNEVKSYLARLTTARAELAAEAQRQRGPIEDRLRNIRGSRELLLQILGEGADQQATQVCDPLDVEIDQLEDKLRLVTADPRVRMLAKREVSERTRQRRLERMLGSLAAQLAAPGKHVSFWQYLRRIEGSG